LHCVICRILAENQNEATHNPPLSAAAANNTADSDELHPPVQPDQVQNPPGTSEVLNDPDISDSAASDSAPHPRVCTLQQFKAWQKSHEWLDCYQSGAVYCSACKHCAADSAFVSGCGQEVKSAKVLLKKVYKHEQSLQHKDCVDKLQLSKCRNIENAAHTAQSVFEQQNKQKIEVTSRVFRTVYECAKSCLSFSELSRLSSLQELNGLEMGNILTSHQSAANIAEHVAHDMRQELVSHVIQSGSKFSLMVDESTNVSQQQSMIVYIRAEFDRVACNYFLDCIPVAQTNAESLFESLMSCLHALGFTDEILKTQMIGFCSDGASNMTGKFKGLATLLKQTVGQHLQIFHCMAHRLELAIHSTVKEINPIGHFRILLDSLYAFYSRSPKNQRELEQHANDVAVELLKVGRVFDVRWVFSSFRAVRALWRDHPALCNHLQAAAADSSRSGPERAKCKGLLSKLTSWQFLTELAMVKDALRLLQELSLYLQRERASAVDALYRVEALTKTFLAYKSQSGQTLQKFLSGFNETKTFKGTPVPEPTEKQMSDFDTLCKRFYQSLADNVSSRFSEAGLLAMAKVLCPSVWPDDETDKMLYGDKELASLAKLLGLNVPAALADFREHKINTKRVGKTLRELKQTVELFPVASAECERGFSAMNLQHTSTRNSLLINTISSLLMIQINGPPLAFWPVTRYVLSWLKKGRHAATDKRTGKPSLAVEPSHSSRLFL